MEQFELMQCFRDIALPPKDRRSNPERHRKKTMHVSES